jgi:two-component system, NarL family, response regulator NreC
MPNPDASHPEGDEPFAAKTIRIVLADDHPVVRHGLRLLLDEVIDFEVVAEAAGVEEARRYVRGHHPIVLVLDLNMPGGSSLDAISAMRSEFPGMQIVVPTVQPEPAFARQAFVAGAIGYVVKQAAGGELVEAVRLGSGSSPQPQPAPHRRLT